MRPAPLTWARRSEPLPVVAVTARPDDIGALVAATADRVRAGSRLRLVAAAAGCVVLGPEPELPWFPGAVYLGREAGALVPTTLTPAPSADLVLLALRDRLPAGCDLVALLPWAVLAAPTPARPVGAAELEQLPGGQSPDAGRLQDDPSRVQDDPARPEDVA